MPNIYHQLGFRYKWNLESIRNDSTGDGVILGPRYMSPNDVRKVPANIRKQSFFDPQFFLPSSGKGKLPEYDFFPNVVADGFTTVDYDSGLAAESADRCVKFQLDQGLRYCVIPTRYREGSPTDFIDSQMEMFVVPFLDSHSRSGSETPLILQLIMTEPMLKDERFRNNILNWVTGIDEIEGVYLIPQSNRNRKQVDDVEYLVSLMNFVYALRENELRVIAGYLNTEVLPLLAADPNGVTLGSYENLRIFNLRAFENEDQGQMRGPKARFYISRLLQWVEHDYLGAIQRAVGRDEAFFDENAYTMLMFSPTYNWHFQKSEPYRHYFKIMSRQIRFYSDMGIDERCRRLTRDCREAYGEFQKLEDRGLLFDTNSDGSHLPRWVTALNDFGREHGLI